MKPLPQAMTKIEAMVRPESIDEEEKVLGTATSSVMQVHVELIVA